MWFPSHIKENKLNSLWKISLLQCLKKEHHVTMIHCSMLILSECWRAHEQNPIISVPEHCKGKGQAMPLRPTHNAPGPTKSILVHALTAFPHSELGPSVSPSYFIISATTKSSEPKKHFFSLLFVIQHEVSLFVLCSRRQMMGKTFLKLFHLSMTNAEIYMKHKQNGNIDSEPSVQMKSATT